MSLIFLFSHIRNSFFVRTQFSKKAVYTKYIRIFSLLSACILCAVYLKPITDFYTFETNNYSTADTMRILYANIYKHNTEYEKIQTMIERENPDVVMFVEFAEDHYHHLKDFLSKRYPYINQITWSKKFIGSIVFSKYPVNNLADDFPQGAWRYGYFSITREGKPYYVYLVHTSSPFSYAYFINRNEQLQTVEQDILKHSIHRDPQAPLLMLGDFNLSPRSYYYTVFDSSLSGVFKNMTRRMLPIFTWSLGGFQVIASHIDHVFANGYVDVQSIRQLTVPGSDHRGYILEVK